MDLLHSDGTRSILQTTDEIQTLHLRQYRRLVFVMVEQARRRWQAEVEGGCFPLLVSMIDMNDKTIGYIKREIK